MKKNYSFKENVLEFSFIFSLLHIIDYDDCLGLWNSIKKFYKKDSHMKCLLNWGQNFFDNLNNNKEINVKNLNISE